MVEVHNLGFFGISSLPKLKFTKESYWLGKSNKEGLLNVAGETRKINWNHQKSIDLVAVANFFQINDTNSLPAMGSR